MKKTDIVKFEHKLKRDLVDASNKNYQLIEAINRLLQAVKSKMTDAEFQAFLIETRIGKT